MRISDWSSDVCSSDLLAFARRNVGELVADSGGTSVRRVDVGCDLLVWKESHILVAMGFAREYGPRLHLGIGDHDVLPPPVPGFISRARFGRWNLVKLYRLGIGIIDDGRRRLRAGQQRSRIRFVIIHGAKPSICSK